MIRELKLITINFRDKKSSACPKDKNYKGVSDPAFIDIIETMTLFKLAKTRYETSVTLASFPNQRTMFSHLKAILRIGPDDEITLNFTGNDGKAASIVNNKEGVTLEENGRKINLNDKSVFEAFKIKYANANFKVTTKGKGLEKALLTRGKMMTILEDSSLPPLAPLRPQVITVDLKPAILKAVRESNEAAPKKTSVKADRETPELGTHRVKDLLSRVPEAKISPRPAKPVTVASLLSSRAKKSSPSPFGLK